MFESLRDLSLVRTKAQAFGFYLAYILFGFIIFSIIGAVLGLFGVLGETEAEIEQTAKTWGHILGPVYCASMAYIVAEAKGVSMKGRVLMSLSGLLFAFLGVPVGMIPATYLTTTARK